MTDLTPLEIADAMKITALAAKPYKEFAWQYEAATQAESIFRKIASGEYAPVVHANWISCVIHPGAPDWVKARLKCSRCVELFDLSENDHVPKHCPSCGALMDESDTRQTQGGKDDSHAEK